MDYFLFVFWRVILLRIAKTSRLFWRICEDANVWWDSCYFWQIWKCLLQVIVVIEQLSFLADMKISLTGYVYHFLTLIIEQLLFPTDYFPHFWHFWQFLTFLTVFDILTVFDMFDILTFWHFDILTFFNIFEQSLNNLWTFLHIIDHFLTLLNLLKQSLNFFLTSLNVICNESMQPLAIGLVFLLFNPFKKKWSPRFTDRIQQVSKPFNFSF